MGIPIAAGRDFYKRPANDPATFTGVSVLLIAIALVASYVPARRATRINPIATLRAE